MDWRLVGTTFVAIFLAELGDKTQLATMGMASGDQRSKWAVFLGASTALVATSAVAVLAGEAISRVVPEQWIGRAAGILFLVIGAYTLWDSFQPPAP